MSSIRHAISTLFYKQRFRGKLNKIQAAYGKDVVQRFDMPLRQDTYWVDCEEQTGASPREINEPEESGRSIPQQAQGVVRSWLFFPKSLHRDLADIVKYVIYLRKRHQQGAARNVVGKEVSDHIYEM